MSSRRAARSPLRRNRSRSKSSSSRDTWESYGTKKKTKTTERRSRRSTQFVRNVSPFRSSLPWMESVGTTEKGQMEIAHGLSKKRQTVGKDAEIQASPSMMNISVQTEQQMIHFTRLAQQGSSASMEVEQIKPRPLSPPPPPPPKPTVYSFTEKYKSFSMEELKTKSERLQLELKAVFNVIKMKRSQSREAE